MGRRTPLARGTLPSDERKAQGLALTKSQYLLKDGVLYGVEKDKTLCVIPPRSLRKEPFHAVTRWKFFRSSERGQYPPRTQPTILVDADVQRHH